MKEKYIIIIGCGTFGSTLANRLSSAGHSLVVIDQQEASFKNLGDEYSGFIIHGDANEFLIISQAKVDKADIVLALTDDDNLNIMLSQICTKLYNVPRVVARVNNPSSSSVFSKLGIETICPALLGCDALEKSLDDALQAGAGK
ncbi:hypothetical protein MASR2M64_17300 [Candidatus Cloacimonadota bacterium]